VVDGAISADDVVGWGPAGGYVYQKAFVELFVDGDVVKALENKIRKEGNGCVDFLAANAQVRPHLRHLYC
jgi:methylenetetrahydrofolate reductase (NADPH)